MLPFASSLLALALASQADQPAFGTSEADAAAWIAENCLQHQWHVIEATRFPYAEHAETHLLCTLEDRQIMLSWADDQLVQIETRGMLADILPETGPAMEIQHLRIYPDEVLIHDTRRERTLQLPELNYAANLVAWDNPVWSAGEINAGAWFIPPEIRFGASIEDMEAALAGRCDFLVTRPIDEAWLLTEPEEQYQTDCFGYEIAGYPRMLELVYGDGQLEQVWLLVGPADIERLRTHFTAIHGAPTEEDAQYIVFADWEVAVRKDVPEILLGSDRLQAIWRQ